MRYLRSINIPIPRGTALMDSLSQAHGYLGYLNMAVSHSMAYWKTRSNGDSPSQKSESNTPSFPRVDSSSSPRRHDAYTCVNISQVSSYYWDALIVAHL